MKIIQIIQRPQLRGAEVFACQLSQEINRLGSESIIVTVFDGNSKLPFDGRIISLNGSPARRVWDWKAWKKLAEIIIQEKPDIIQANAGDSLKYAVFSKLFFRWKVPIVFRNASTISLYLGNPVIKWWNSALFRYVTAVVSVSEYSRRDFASTFSHSSGKISVIPIGINTNPPNPESVDRMGDPLFVHIGGFTFEKNHKDLVEIFARIRQKYPEAVLALIGDGPLKSNIKDRVDEMGMQDAIFFLGYQNNPARFLKGAKCLLLPSIIEGLPSVILEAFLFRVPVVACDVGGVSEIVMPGKTGWLVKKNDVDGFVSAVSELMENYDEARSLADQGHTMVQQQYGIDKIANRFLKFYLEIIGSARPYH